MIKWRKICVTFIEMCVSFAWSAKGISVAWS